jgi:hypothetical protein
MSGRAGKRGKMNTLEYILSKQEQWALGRGRDLVGSTDVRGRKMYTRTLRENLFEPLLPSVERAFHEGDGGELGPRAGSPPKMHAVHSSAALGVNVFHHWLTTSRAPEIAWACGFCRRGNRSPQSIRFEVKFQISSAFHFSPNLDVIIGNAPGSRFSVFAVESKFSEPYSQRGPGGVAQEYLEMLSLWKGLPALKELAATISPGDDRFVHLHVGQLIKHILGLKAAFGIRGFRLLYLWYDGLGAEGARHRAEIEEVVSVASADGIKLHALSYLDLIVRLANEFRDSDRDYIDYISNRYL